MDDVTIIVTKETDECLKLLQVYGIRLTKQKVHLLKYVHDISKSETKQYSKMKQRGMELMG